MRTAIIGAFLLLVLIASPAAAEVVLNNGGVPGSQTIEISGSDLNVDVSELGSYGIVDAYFHEVSPGTTVTVTLSRPNGDTWTGSYGHIVTGVTGNVSYSLGPSPVTSHEYFALFPGDCIFWIGYASDLDAKTSGIALIDIPSHASDACYVPVPSINTLPITRIQATTDTGDEIRIVAHYAATSAVTGHIDHGAGQKTAGEYLSSLLDFVGAVWGVIMFSVTVFKFIFIDNFFAVLTLYESVVLAYSAHKARDIVVFARNVVRYNERFFTIIFKFIFGLASFLYSVIRSINPLSYLLP